MPIFYPTIDVRGVCDITLELLGRLGVRALILDVDNTLTTHDNPVPSQGVREWLAEMGQAGIPMMIVSNNHYERVKPFAQLLGLPFVEDGRKPLSSGMSRAAQSMGVSPREIAVVGDQIFTDILGGNLFGAKTILVQPIELEDKPFFKCKRFLEKGVLRRYQRRKTR